MTWQPSDGISALDDAAAAVNLAQYALHRIRRRLGYLISAEQDADLKIVESALKRIMDYQGIARSELSEAFQRKRDKR